MALEIMWTWVIGSLAFFLSTILIAASAVVIVGALSFLRNVR